MKRIFIRLALAIAMACGVSTSVAAQARVQSEAEAIAQDAAQYALRHGVDPAEAIWRLRAQEDSVGATDRIARRYRNRLAGISIEHAPEYRIVVLLTGSAAVATRTIRAGGRDVPVLFRTGALATRDRLAAAIVAHRDAIRSILPRAQGMGVDMRTGELVIVVQSALDAEEDAAAQAELAALTGVPVRIRALEGADMNLAGALGIDSGTRLEGVDPRDGLRYACTTGFVVTDTVRTGIVTAAHCPDTLTAYDPAGNGTPLEFVGQWGVGFQDVQVHVREAGGENDGEPLFYADTGTGTARRLTGSRPRESTRAGDAICHRGEASGYSCSEVELVDYAPGGALCAGPCDPVWTTVAGPSCRGGDSGGPVFSGTVAFGIAKGGSYDRAGRCGFYYYMSTDFLPDGWTLLLDGNDDDAAHRRSAAASR